MSDGVDRYVSVLASVFAVGVVLALGIYHGAQPLVVPLQPMMAIQIVITNAVPAILLFCLFVTASGLLLTREVYQSRDRLGERTSGPRITAIVPAYRDADIVDRSVSALLQSTYDNLDVAIVCEPDDEETLAAARELATHPDVQCLVNDNPGTKAGAINSAVARIDSDYFAAFDADEEAAPEFAAVAMAQLTDGRDVFQARRVPRVTGPVEALAYCERLLFNAGYKLIEPAGFTYCRSSSVAFRRDAFETVDGLDELVTEDIDFAHKCFRHRLDVKQARNITSEMEAPHTLRDFWQQRKRWRLGHIEVFLKALRGGFAVGGLRGLISTVRIGTVLLTSILLVAFVGKGFVLLLFGWFELFTLPLLVITLVLGPILRYDYQNGHIRTRSPVFLLVPLVYPLFGLVTIRSAIEYFVDWDGEWYQVTKSGS